MKHLLSQLLVSLLLCLLIDKNVHANNVLTIDSALKPIVVGAEQFSLYLPLIKGKRVGLVVNQTSRANQQHLVDALVDKNIDVKVIFAPEHGFRGDHDAGETFDSSVDKKTGISIVSIYGKNRKPRSSVMASIDVIIFDIQDVGVRFYTFISSMHYMMESAAENNVDFIVLDRPNPNGMFVDGPVLEPAFKSFVGLHEIPLLHGLTVGELALMIKGEHWLTLSDKSKALNLRVIPMINYSHKRNYSLPIAPSPNLPNDFAIALYPSLGFFEATPVSIGRGTPLPFQVIGHDKVSIGDYQFTPISTKGSALIPKLMNKKLRGTKLRDTGQRGLNLNYFLTWYKAFNKSGLTFFERKKFMDKLAGTDKLRKAIEAGKTEVEIRKSWQLDLLNYIKKRKPYLLYPDYIKNFN